MDKEEKPREVFAGREYKILEIGKVAENRHYLIIPPEEKLPEGMEAQFSFFRKIISDYLEEIKASIKNDFEGKFGEITGFRIGVNFGSAGFEKTPHIHILPLAKGEKIKPRLVEQTIETE